MPIRSEIQRAAFIAAASIGDNELVAAVAGKRIQLRSLVLVATGTQIATLWSDVIATGSQLTGDMPFVANGQLVLEPDDGGWVETVAGESLNLQLSAAVAVDGFLTYVLVE